MISKRAAVVLAACTALTACAPRPAPTAQSRADRATVNACRQRADAIYQRQNRASLFAQDERYSPESGSYNSGITTRGLADRYGWDLQVSDCIRNQGATSESPASTGPTMVPTSR